MSNLDHKSNFFSTMGLLFLGLSLTEKVSFILTIIVLLIGGISNYFSMLKNKKALDNERKKSKIMENLNKDEKQTN